MAWLYQHIEKVSTVLKCLVSVLVFVKKDVWRLLKVSLGLTGLYQHVKKVSAVLKCLVMDSVLIKADVEDCQDHHSYFILHRVTSIYWKCLDSFKMPCLLIETDFKDCRDLYAYLYSLAIRLESFFTVFSWLKDLYFLLLCLFVCLFVCLIVNGSNILCQGSLSTSYIIVFDIKTCLVRIIQLLEGNKYQY